MRTTPSSQSGFTLVEIALVVVIGAILVALFSGSIMKMVHQSKLTTTDERIATASAALRTFGGANNRLPCAASRTVAYDDPAYARETSCTGGAPGGTVSVGGVRIGFVPTRVLNLPDEIGYDAWGSRLVYAMTEDLADANQYDLNTGVVEVEDSYGNPVLNNATFVVFSVGPDRRGGYNSAGALMANCTIAGGSLDTRNCDDLDKIFVSGPMADVQNSPAHYDDKLVYEANFQQLAIPESAIMAYDRGQCPTGWSEFAPAEGRLIIGKGTYKEPTAPDFETGSTVGSKSFGLGDTGGWNTRLSDQTAPQRVANLPPHVGYTYCRQDIGVAYVVPSTSSSGSTTSSASSTSSTSSTSASSSSSSSGGGGGGGWSVICTHFYRRRMFTRELWLSDMEYAYNDFFPCTLRGYHFWAIPVVRMMRMHPWTERIVFPLAYARAEEIAYQSGRMAKPNYFGKLVRLVVEPLSFVIGTFVPAQDWEKVHADMPALPLK